MKSNLSAQLALAAAAICVTTATWAQTVPALPAGNFSDPQARAAAVQSLRDNAESEKSVAWQRASRERWSTRGQTAGRHYELQAIRGERLFVLGTDNANAAISTAANLVRNTAPYNANGSGFTIGEWDGGAPLTTHQELVGRINVKDGGSTIDHATHVAGTLAASGVVASALGMAPGALIDSYEWSSDVAEMTSRGMATMGEAGKITLSNHSYGYLSGWESGAYSGNNGAHWFGQWGNRESENFGQYDSDARAWDVVCVADPFYLPFKSAGNDRDNAAPSVGSTFYYYSNGWKSKTYVAATDPFSDGWDNGGFDTIPLNGVAKNIMTVGAVSDAVAGGTRSLANASMAAFSGWGPSDDGRVKPDIVANGTGLHSSISSSTSAYADYNGTSMSTPNACGSAVLLVDDYENQFPGQYMRASTLKGLILHTADDLGNAGPDYAFGWGLMNTKAAADLIHLHAADPGALHITESFLNAATTSRTNVFTWDGVNPIRATLCWTDPAGTAQTALDSSTRNLVNDLDLRIISPLGQTNFPYVLSPASPNSPATTGNNNRDNVEQVVVPSPATSGLYRVTVRLSSALTGSSQFYSVILSGSLSPQRTLTVAGTPAPVGSVAPAYGTQTSLWGSVVTGTASESAGTTNATGITTYLADGWIGSGSVPASGSTTNTGPFTLTTNSLLTWKWLVKDRVISNQTVTLTTNLQARDTITARDQYTVDPSGNVTLEAGTLIQLDPGFAANPGSKFQATVTNH